jgi:hypothetical protein
MRIDLPSARAVSGSFFEPNSTTSTIATISRCQGSSPLRSIAPPPFLASVGGAPGSAATP